MDKKLQISKYEEKILSLSRHFVWADKMKYQFGEALANEGIPKYIDNNWYISNAFMYMALWYALLFEVIEFLNKCNMKVASVQDKINGYYDLLSSFRNAVFHVKGELHPNDLYKILRKGEKSAGDIREINDEIGKFLENLMNKLTNRPIK